MFYYNFITEIIKFQHDAVHFAQFYKVYRDIFGLSYAY